jgi:hypothetical protein
MHGSNQNVRKKHVYVNKIELNLDFEIKLLKYAIYIYVIKDMLFLY